MQTFVIERDIPGIGAMSPAELAVAAKTSNAALAELAPRVQWQHSWIADNKSFCVYMADDAEAIEEHAKASGFPASKITPIGKRIDPTTANI